MAGLWTGTAINSNATAMVFNQLFNKKALPMVRKKNGLLYKVLGKEEVFSNPSAPTGFQRLKKVTGKNVEVKLLGKLRNSGSGAQLQTVSDGSSEVASATADYDSALFGAAEFSLAHYAHKYAIPHSELDRFAGDEAKTASYIDDIFDMLVYTMEDVVGTAINTAQNCARTTIGGWPWAVSDGQSSGESSYASYGTIDRSDTGNNNFDAYVLPNTGTLTLGAIRTVQDNVAANGGNPSLGIAAVTVYGLVRQLVEQYTIVQYNADKTEFGGKYFSYDGIDFVLDQRAPSAVLGLLEPESWAFYMNEYNFTKGGIINDPSLVASYSINWGFWCQFIATAPSHNGKLTGVTG